MREFIKKLRGRFAYEVVIILFLFSILLIVGSLVYRSYLLGTPTDKNFKEYVLDNKNDNTNTIENQNNANTPTVAQKPLPDKILINMPFTTQSPFANWDELHEEACEEASLIMLRHYKNNTAIESKEKAEEEILELVNFENENGHKVDVTVSELAQIARKKYNMTSGRVKTNATIEDIKREIASGRPVIIPAAGKLLENPNFRSGGPVYHMFVLKGYDKDGFIANDPGTRKGEGFRYSFDIISSAMHDWNQENILNGGKNYLVFD